MAGAARLGQARHGKEGKAGMVTRGFVRHGSVRQARRRVARPPKETMVLTVASLQV